MTISLTNATPDLDRPEPRGRGQVAVSKFVAGRNVTVKIGRYPTHNSIEYRITGKGIKQRSYYDWSSALKDAVHLVETKAKIDPAGPMPRTLDCKEADHLDRLKDLAVRAKVTVPKLLDIITMFLLEAETQTQQNENEHYPEQPADQ